MGLLIFIVLVLFFVWKANGFCMNLFGKKDK